MRILTGKEMIQRGCMYCLDYGRGAVDVSERMRNLCRFNDGCPYHELDNFTSYNKYMKSPCQKSLKQLLIKAFDLTRKSL